jgi:endonuclease III
MTRLMPARRPALREIVARLTSFYGAPGPPPATDPFALVIWENAAYLVDDRRRLEVFRRLEREIGIAPEVLLAVPLPRLAAILEGGGMFPEMRAEKLHAASLIALEAGPERLRALLFESPREARRLLKRFPGIADPGADKILLFAGAGKSLAPDSNALRVLVRLGFGEEDSSYSRQYRSAATAVAPELPDDTPWLIAAHLLLRQHGQELCKRNNPRCGACPLNEICRWYLSR